MDSNSKQRLAGVMVIIALATIVLPIVFHHRNDTELALSIPEDAPPPPALPKIRFAPEPSIANKTATTANTNVSTNQMANGTTSTPNTNIASTSHQATAAAEHSQMQQASKPTSQTIATTSVNATANQPAIPANRNTIAKAPVIAPTKIASASNNKTTKNIVSSNVKAVEKKNLAPKTIAKHLHKAIAPKNSWIVQLGSFKNHSNANKLVTQLRSKGFTAFIEPSSKKKGAPIRVCIGPELHKQKAKMIVKDLAKKLHMKGIVVRHHI